MKTKHILLTLVLAFISLGNIIASPLPPKPDRIVMNRDELISQNLAKVRYCQVYASASSMLYSSTTKNSFTAYYTSTTPRVAEMLALLSSQTLVYNLAKPESDTVYVNAYYYDSDWQEIFQGGTGFKLESDGKGGWRVPAGASVLDIQPVGERYHFDGLSGAHFVEYDDAGNPINWISIQTNSWDESFSLPFYLLDRKGVLYVNTYNKATGTYDTLAYDSETGKQISPYSVTSTTSGGFNSVNVVVPKNGLIDGPVIQSNQGIGYTTVLEVEITTAGTYNLHQTTSESELPNTFVVWKVGDSIQTEYDRPSNANTTPVFLQKGLYHIRFIWPFLKSPNSTIIVVGGGQG